MSEFRKVICSIRCLDHRTVEKVRGGLAGSALSKVPYVCSISGEAEEVQLASAALADAVAQRVEGLVDGADALLVIAVLKTFLCECDLATLAEESDAVVLAHIDRLEAAGILKRREIHGMNYFGVGGDAFGDAVSAAVTACLDRD